MHTKHRHLGAGLDEGFEGNGRKACAAGVCGFLNQDWMMRCVLELVESALELVE